MKISKHPLLFLIAMTIGLVSCKQKEIVLLPGAVVTQDGTSDGMSDYEDTFKETSRSNEGVIVTLSSDLLFPTNSSYLTDNAKAELDKLADLLKKNNKNLRVDGHTDATGTAHYNEWLSEKRANSVKDYLVAAGISSGRISIKGYGQEKPVGDNKTVEGRKLNRRVEVVILD